MSYLEALYQLQSHLDYQPAYRSIREALDDFPDVSTDHPLERAARLYGSNREAAAALGMHEQAFGRACIREGIKTPPARRGEKRRGRQQDA